jgi:hypothetical protein
VNAVQSIQSVPLTNPRLATSRHREARAPWRIPDFVKGMLIGATILVFLWLLL